MNAVEYENSHVTSTVVMATNSKNPREIFTHPHSFINVRKNGTFTLGSGWIGSGRVRPSRIFRILVSCLKKTTLREEIIILSYHYITSIPGRRSRAQNRRCPEKHMRAALSAVPIDMPSFTPIRPMFLI